MTERPVKVRCHGVVKRLRITGNLNNVLKVIRQGFDILADADITLTMVVEGNGTPRPVTEQTLQYNWNKLQELNVTLPRQAQRALVNPAHLQTVIEGRLYKIDEPPSRNSQVVQKCRRDMGIMKNIAEFKNMFPRTISLVGDLHCSVSTLKTSFLVRGTNLVSKSKSVVKSLIDIFVKSESAFEGLSKLCATVTDVLQQLSLDLVNGDHQPAIAILEMLMSKGDEMEKVARELDGSIERSMGEIDGAVQTIANEKKQIETKVDHTTREKNRTEEKIKRQSLEIDRLESKLREYTNEIKEKKKNAAISGTTTGVGVGLTVAGVLFPPLLLAGIPTLVGSSIYLGVTVSQIKDLKNEISAAKDEKRRDERRKEELKQTLSELRSDLRKLEPISTCLHDVWGQMVGIKAAVKKMESFWPGLNDFCKSVMASEQRMVSVMKSDSTNPVTLSDAFKSQIVNFSARQV
ncbi:uncharacterized protein LOC135491693 [Lineus longissimus]|uniref:uncharacterized protein LOC135491693 n=1 Tax=Lineus longissimus TaxID=88925 RepID=UPI00315CD0D0